MCNHIIILAKFGFFSAENTPSSMSSFSVHGPFQQFHMARRHTQMKRGKFSKAQPRSTRKHLQALHLSTFVLNPYSPLSPGNDSQDTCAKCRVSPLDATMAREARCRQALRQRVSHHMMLAQWNQFNYTAQAQLAKVVFPDFYVTRITVPHSVHGHSCQCRDLRSRDLLSIWTHLSP